MNSFYKKLGKMFDRKRNLRRKKGSRKRNGSKKEMKTKTKYIKERKQFQHQQKTLNKMERTRDVLGVVTMIGTQLLCQL